MALCCCCSFLDIKIFLHQQQGSTDSLLDFFFFFFKEVILSVLKALICVQSSRFFDLSKSRTNWLELQAVLCIRIYFALKVFKRPQNTIYCFTKTNEIVFVTKQMPLNQWVHKFTITYTVTPNHGLITVVLLS